MPHLDTAVIAETRKFKCIFSYEYTASWVRRENPDTD